MSLRLSGPGNLKQMWAYVPVKYILGLKSKEAVKRSRIFNIQFGLKSLGLFGFSSHAHKAK